MRLHTACLAIRRCCITVGWGELEWALASPIEVTRVDIISFSFFKKWANPGLFFVYLWTFQKINTNFTINQCEKCPSSIRGSRPRTLFLWMQIKFVIQQRLVRASYQVASKGGAVPITHERFSLFYFAVKRHFWRLHHQQQQLQRNKQNVNGEFQVGFLFSELSDIVKMSWKGEKRIHF